MNKEIMLNSDKLKREKKISKTAKLILLILTLLLLILYLVFGLIYNRGNFSITLDKNLYFEKNLIIYDNPEYKIFRTELYAEVPEVFDNISYKWLPDDITDHDGSHNGDNYVAYTFYIENIGKDISDYWSEIVIDDVIKNLDEAVRVRVYKENDYVTYAKVGKNGQPEKETVPFESDKIVVSDHVESFKPGDKTKYTILLWLEGSDPECNDNILGGEIKIHMNFNSEFVEK